MSCGQSARPLFYLGTHEPSWLSRGDVGVPLFISRRRLVRRKSAWPKARVRWALDSGGFTELQMFGRWRTPREQYVEEIKRWSADIGRLDWVAPQDWMCEPAIINGMTGRDGKVVFVGTGLSVAEHQRRTIQSVIDLRGDLAGVAHVIPVLQGWELGDYLSHVEQYREAGFDLAAEPVVGVGSVCRRQALSEAATIMRTLAGLGLRLHGFGIKGEALERYGSVMASADSMAWSYAGRKRPDPQCAKKSCANCLHYALEWRRQAVAPRQLNIFTGWFG